MSLVLNYVLLHIVPLFVSHKRVAPNVTRYLNAREIVEGRQADKQREKKKNETHLISNPTT